MFYLSTVMNTLFGHTVTYQSPSEHKKYIGYQTFDPPLICFAVTEAKGFYKLSMKFRTKPLARVTVCYLMTNIYIASLVITIRTGIRPDILVLTFVWLIVVMMHRWMCLLLSEWITVENGIVLCVCFLLSSHNVKPLKDSLMCAT